MRTELVQNTSKGRFVIRPAEPGDENKIFISWEQAFNKKIDRETWRWKYHTNPQGCRTMLCLAENGEVAVHYAAQVYKINFGGTEKLALHLTDNFSHPKYRWALGGKTGLFVKTSWAFLKTYLEDIPIESGFELYSSLPKAHFHYGFPGIRHYRLGAKLMYYRRFNPGTLYVKFQGELRAERKKKFTLYRCKAAEPIPAGKIDKLWRKVANKCSPFSVIRDYSFLKWRYFSKPGHDYTLYCLEKRLFGSIAAWLIFTWKAGEDRSLCIVDFLAETDSALKMLLQGLTAFSNAETIECWCSANHPQRHIFAQAGFMQEEEPLGIVPCTRCDQTGVSPDKADEFIWTMGDADLF